MPTRNDDTVWPSTRIVGPKLRINATPSVGTSTRLIGPS